MHPTGHQIEVPLEELENKLIQCTDPAFTGNLEVTLSLRPMAAQEVEWRFVTERHVPDPATVTAKLDSGDVTNQRVATVRRWLAEVRGKLLIELPRCKLRASFLKGEMRALKIEEVSQ